MVVSLTADRNEGDSGPSAEEPSNNYRGGTINLASKESDNDDMRPNPTQGRHASGHRQLKTRKNVLQIGTMQTRAI